MAPDRAVRISPAELSFIYNSLLQNPPIRPDGRSPTQFRPLVAETDILSSTNGSARICFSDGTEAIVGVKAEVEKTDVIPHAHAHRTDSRFVKQGGNEDVEMDDDDSRKPEDVTGSDSWLEMSIEIPGFRDDDQLPVFLASMISEALLADGKLRDRLYINTRYHWRMYIDILLLSTPLSYPLPLLSLTTHLALLSTKIPALVSEKDEDPLFNDDWDAAQSLYKDTTEDSSKPPITLLVMAAGDNIFFDPTQEELAVADSLLAVSVAEVAKNAELSVLALRAIDPPSRSTNPAMPNSMNTATGGTQPASSHEAVMKRESISRLEVWSQPRGGIRRGAISKMINSVVAVDGVGREILAALDAVEK